MNMVAAKLRLT